MAAGDVPVEASCLGECDFAKNNNTGRHRARRRSVAVHGAHALCLTDDSIGYRSIGVRGFVVVEEDAARPEDGPRRRLRCYGANEYRRLCSSFI